MKAVSSWDVRSYRQNYDGRIFVVQARPITILPQPRPVSST